jgi:hypothetical protein
MENLIFLADLLKDSAIHFLFSGSVGAIVYLLTQIILFAAFRIFRGNVPLTLGQKCFILGLALVLGFCSAYFAHVSLDIFSDWWETPLAPPLQLDFSDFV